jgi:hypothetical protein
VADYLPNMLEALNSIPSTGKKKNKTKKISEKNKHVSCAKKGKCKQSYNSTSNKKCAN